MSIFKVKKTGIFLLCALIIVTNLAGVMVFPSDVHAFTQDNASTAISDFINVYWDANAKYFFCNSDRQAHSEHAHGPQNGLYTDYWWEAQLWETVMDVYERTGSTNYRQMIDDIYDGFFSQYPSWQNNSFNDDIAWWALACIRAYEITGDVRYRARSKEMFDFIYAKVTSEYGGGIWWNDINFLPQKNMATNGTAAIVAVKLKRALNDDTYLTKAQSLFNWVRDRLYAGSGKVNDHIEGTGSGTLVTWEYTYNHGIYLDAAYEMYKETNNNTYLNEAIASADWIINKMTLDGSMIYEGENDQPGFKMIFCRFLNNLRVGANQTQYLSFLQRNATQAWNHRRSTDGIIGSDWTLAPTSAYIQSIAAAAGVSILQLTPPDSFTGVVIGNGVFEAENAHRYGISNENTNMGYTGRGYTAGWNNDNTSIDFPVNVSTAGTYKLAFRHSAAAGNALRQLKVNGNTVVSNLTFAGTSDWTAYVSTTVAYVMLNAGANIINLGYNASVGSTNWLNLDKMTVELSPGIKVACIGDSITAGAGLSDPSSQSYPARLGQLLGSSCNVMNFGVSGRTLLKNGDYPYWNETAFADSSNWLPDIVVIMLGTNDSKSQNWQYQSQFVNDYKDMINHYRNLPSHPTVYVNTCPTVYKSGNYGITNPIVANEVNPKIIQTANETGCPLININQITGASQADYPDNIHPDANGAEVIAKAVFNNLSTGSKYAYGIIEAENFNNQGGGVVLDNCTEGGKNLGGIQNNCYTEYSNVDFGSTPSTSVFTARAASGIAGGRIEIRLDGISGTKIGECTVSGTGGWQNWATVSCNTSSVSGIHNVYLVYKGSSYLFNINWFKFIKAKSIQARIEAEGFNDESGNVFLDQCAEGGRNIGGLQNDYFTGYNYVDFGSTGVNTAKFRVASAAAGGTIEIHLGSPTGTLIGTCTVPGTGDWQNWQTVSCPVSNTAGMQNVYLVFKGSGYLFNVNWFKFQNTSVVSANSVIDATAYTAKNGNVFTENGSAPDHSSIGGIAAGDWARYDGIDFGTGAYNTFMCFAACPNDLAGKNIEIRLDSSAGTLIGTLTVTGTGGWGVYKEQYAGVSGVTGVHSVYLRFPDSPVVNLDWFTFGINPDNETAAQKDLRMQWWKEARFGQFVHFGAYAQLAGTYNGQTTGGYSEWIMYDKNIPKTDYETLAARPFNPVDFDAHKLVADCKNAGQKYLVFTSKHHEGFSMFETNVNGFYPYDIAHYGSYGSDPLLAVSRECKAQGIRFGIYYSIMDWHHRTQSNLGATMLAGEKDIYAAEMKEQLSELIQNYDPDILWFDGEWNDWWTVADGSSLIKYLRTLKPGLIINNRVGKRGYGDGDFGTPEQTIPATGIQGYWESCMTINDTWGYKAEDTNWKSTALLVSNLVETASKGGNYLLDVGPDSSGKTPQASVDRLNQMGEWLGIYGESIYGTNASCFPDIPLWGYYTTKPGKLYAHILTWPDDNKIVIPALNNQINNIYLLNDPSTSLNYDTSGGYITILLPSSAPNQYDSVVALDIAGTPAPLNLALNKPAAVSNYYFNNASYNGSKAVDGDNGTRWATDDGTSSCWLEVDFGRNTTFNQTVIKECIDYGQRVAGYKIQYWDGSNWLDAYTGTTIGASKTDTFRPVTGSKARLCITASNSSGGPSISEIIVNNTIQVKNAYIQFEAERFNEQSGGLVTDQCSEGGRNIGGIQGNYYAGYNGLDFGTVSPASVQFRVASATAGGTIEIRLGSPSGTLMGTCTVQGTGGWQSWQTVSCPVVNTTGIQNVYLVFKGDGFLFNVNWFKFIESVPVTGLTLERTDVDINLGSTVTMAAIVMPANASNKSVVWSSSNTAVAIVDSNGAVTGVGAGNAVITAVTVDGLKTAACNARVLPVLQQVVLAADKRYLKPAEKSLLSVSALMSDNSQVVMSKAQVSYASSNPQAANVDSSGTVTAVGEGKADIEVNVALNGVTKGECIQIIVDNTPPLTVISTSGALRSNGKFNSNVTFTLAPSDTSEGSGVVLTEYSFDNASWQTYNAPVTVTNEGITTVGFRSTDAAGNIEAVQSYNIDIERTPNVLTSDLVEKIKMMGLEQNYQDSIVSILGQVIDSILQGDKSGSVSRLNSFINRVNAEKGKKLTNEQAEQLVSSADYIIDVINAAEYIGIPSKPVLSDDNGQDTGLKDGKFNIAMNLWWGRNGTAYRLYENGVLIDTKSLSDQSPNAQSAITPVDGKINGTYTYNCELSNDYGTIASDSWVVDVTQAQPGKPVLSNDNWDGDGKYTVKMDMWWGINGTLCKLYENGTLIDTQSLVVQSPEAQTISFSVSGRNKGTYRYYCELINYAGVTVSEPLTVTVSQ